MTDDELDDVVRTTVEVDRDVWRELRAEAARNGTRVSNQLEADLRELYDDAQLDESDDVENGGGRDE